MTLNADEMDDHTGKGVYPFYDAHWHLRDIGVLHGDKAGLYASNAWAEAEYMAKRREKQLAASSEKSPGMSMMPTRIALIDNSVDAGHPNLEGAIDTSRAIDFFSHDLGILAEPGAASFQEIAKPDALLGHSQELQHIYKRLLARLQDPASPGARRAQSIRAATSPNFSAHGTGMAGLIGARPVLTIAEEGIIEARKYDGVDDAVGKALAGGGMALPYSGVDPYCEIVPISTSFDEDAEQLVSALLYAEIIQADMIVLARDFPDPRKFSQGIEAPTQFAPLAERGEEAALWDALEGLLVAVSHRRPVLCAAGNGADDAVIYPASLRADDNGIIPVGAIVDQVRRAAYSPASDLVRIHAPSGDGERFDVGKVQVDTRSAGFDPAVYPPSYLQDGGSILGGEFAFRDLVTTDVSGKYGYSGGLYNDPANDDMVVDFGSYYTRFSGTSGAVAVAAGFLSLSFTAGRIRRPVDGITGPEVRYLLEQALSFSGRLDQVGGGQTDDAVPVLTWDALPGPTKMS